MRFPHIILTVFLFSSSLFAQGTPDGKVASLTGSLWKEMGRARKDLKQGDSVSVGDVLRTGSGAKAKITLGEDAAFLLSSNSKIIVQKPQKKNWSIQLQQGGILSFFKKKLDSKEEPYQVKTKTATIGVRGTTFFVEATPGKHDYFCPCNGQLKIKTKNSSELIKSEHHDAPKFIETNGRIASTEIKQGHSDEEIAELKALLKN